MKLFRIINEDIRSKAIDAVSNAEDGMLVRISKPDRSLEQNAKFHAICNDLERIGFKWDGDKRTSTEWKELLVSAHSIATGNKDGYTEIRGIEGEIIQLREKTSSMGTKRMASLIEYSEAFYQTFAVPYMREKNGRSLG